MNNEALNYLKELSDEAVSNVGLFMSIGGGTTIFLTSVVLLVFYLLFEFKRASIINKLNEYESNKSLYLSSYNDNSIYLNNTKNDKPILKDKKFISFLSKIGFNKFIKNETYFFVSFLILCGLILFSVFIGLHNSKVISNYFEENLNESYLSDYVNSYEIKSIEVLNSSSNNSYYVILYKNGNEISKYNYYGNLNISNDNKNEIKFYSSKLMNDIEELDVAIDNELYFILNDKYFHSIEVSEDLIKY